jgi:diketogulonate reductase-like aldo/keto reductase
MVHLAESLESRMELADIPAVAEGFAHRDRHLGHWRLDVGGTDEAESVATIRAALDHGINVIDTAPIYGFGRSPPRRC